MLQLEPTRLFSWAFTVADDGKPLGTLDISAWRERGDVTAAGQTFTILRKGFVSSDFRLESRGTIVATATKPSVFRREFAIAFSGRTLRLRPRSAWGRALALLEGEREVGDVRPRGSGPVAPPPRCPTRCPCPSASSCCGSPCSSGSATTTPRPRRGSRRRSLAVALHYVERPAPAPLAAAIECVWSVSDRVARIARPPDRVIPDGRPELIVHRGDRYRRLVDGRPVRQPAAFLAGTLSRPWIVQAPPRVATIGVRLRPGGFTALFGASLAGTADREVPLAELPAPVTALVAAIRGARGPASALRAAEAWLLAHAAAHLPGGRVPAPACAGVVRAIHRRRGRVGVEALAAAVGLPRRRLERLFRRETALSPKQYIRIVRLTALLERLAAPDRDRLIDVALDAGYFDQAHMARDFKALTERRATGRRRDDGELAVHFTRPDRLLRLLTAD